jgi:hypothetical protein
MFLQEKVTGPPGPGHMTTGHREPGHERNRDLAQRGTGAVTAGRPGHQVVGPGDPRAAAPGGAGAPGLPHRGAGTCRGAQRLARGGPIALGSFALVFSEVIPVELLADISGQLRVSIGTGGLMVVVPAVAVAAPLLVLCSARL